MFILFINDNKNDIKVLLLIMSIPFEKYILFQRGLKPGGRFPYNHEGTGRKNAEKGSLHMKPRFLGPFLEKYFGFSKMDKNKCPKMKSQNTFPKKGQKTSASCEGTLFWHFGGQVLHGCRAIRPPVFK